MIVKNHPAVLVLQDGLLFIGMYVNPGDGFYEWHKKAFHSSS